VATKNEVTLRLVSAAALKLSAHLFLAAQVRLAMFTESFF
jgi:hypothetical protein